MHAPVHAVNLRLVLVGDRREAEGREGISSCHVVLPVRLNPAADQF